jgi:RNA polymerase sigma-70 factor (ECF subfamily)
MNPPIPVNDVAINSLKLMSDEWLVLAAKDGNVSAFAELRNRHCRKLLRTAYRITRNLEDAEDALQESLLKAFVHLNKFQGRSSFSSWVTRIAINKSLETIRRRRVNKEHSIDAGDDTRKSHEGWEVRDLSEDPERHYARHEIGELLRGEIRQLCPNLRTVIELQQEHEYSTQQLADSLGISLAAVKSRLLRARASMRASIQRKGVPLRSAVLCRAPGDWQNMDHQSSLDHDSES